MPCHHTSIERNYLSRNSKTMSSPRQTQQQESSRRETQMRHSHGQFPSIDNLETDNWSYRSSSRHYHGRAEDRGQSERSRREDGIQHRFLQMTEDFCKEIQSIAVSTIEKYKRSKERCTQPEGSSPPSDAKNVRIRPC